MELELATLINRRVDYIQEAYERARGKWEPDPVSTWIYRLARINYLSKELRRQERDFEDRMADGPMMVLLGGVGRGKSFMAGLICQRTYKDSELDPTYVGQFMPVMARWPWLLERWKRAEDWGAFVRTDLRLLRNASLLVLDELGREVMTSQERSSFEGLLDERYTLRELTILCLNLPREPFLG